MKAVVVLPTKNEEGNVGYMINEIRSLKLPLFIVDEHSTDKTSDIAKKLNVPVYQRDGSGKGYGVRKAVQIASKKGYDVIVLIDCDRTYPTEHIPIMLKYLPKYDMVIGSRKMGHIKFLHRLPNILHTEAINFLYGVNLRDTNSGLRAFKIDKLKGLDAEGFDIEAQITTKALKRGLEIKEVPIEYKKREGKSKIRIRDGFVILWRIIKERFRM